MNSRCYLCYRYGQSHQDRSAQRLGRLLEDRLSDLHHLRRGYSLLRHAGGPDAMVSMEPAEKHVCFSHAA